MDRLAGSVSVKALFRRTPTICFSPRMEHCPHCATVLQVHKTRKLTVATLPIGTFLAHETILFCPRCEKRYASTELRKLRAYRCRYGYDVMAYAGKAMFWRCRNEGETQLELADKRVRISKREVSVLATKFIVYLSVAHKQSQHRLRELLSSGGGYILHLDATCEGDSPHLMCGLDGITEIVLENEKMCSEKAETIIPFLRKIQNAYGDPLATVHDMGKGISGAVETIFPDTPDLLCYYHFLAAVGKNLLNADNDTLRKRLSKHGIQGKLRMRARELKRKVEKSQELVSSLLKCLERKSLVEGCAVNSMPAVVTYALVLWALAGKKQGDGYGFPFDRPYLSFYGRLETLHPMLTKLNAVRLNGNKKDKKPYLMVIRDLIDIMEDATLRKAAEHMQQKASVFDELRKAMRIALPAGTRGINDRGSNEPMSTIAQRVEKFYAEVQGNEALSGKQEYKHMIAQIKEYWKRLFCDPITVDTPGGTVQIQPQRTNNILEQSFRSWKRIYRKKSGLKPLEKILKAMPANTPLVKNLNNPQYMRILLDGKTTLEERFAQIDANLIRKELAKLSANSDKVPPRIKKLIRQPDLPGQLEAIFAG